MKFTRTEWEIIVHRLEVGDAIIEALTDHAPGELPACDYSAEAIELKIGMLNYNGCTRLCFDELDLIILRECCEGSTFFAGMDDAVATGEITTGYKLNMYRAAKIAR